MQGFFRPLHGLPTMPGNYHFQVSPTSFPMQVKVRRRGRGLFARGIDHKEVRLREWPEGDWYDWEPELE